MEDSQSICVQIHFTLKKKKKWIKIIINIIYEWDEKSLVTCCRDLKLSLISQNETVTIMFLLITSLLSLFEYKYRLSPWKIKIAR